MTAPVGPLLLHTQGKSTWPVPCTNWIRKSDVIRDTKCTTANPFRTDHLHLRPDTMSRHPPFLTLGVLASRTTRKRASHGVQSKATVPTRCSCSGFVQQSPSHGGSDAYMPLTRGLLLCVVLCICQIYCDPDGSNATAGEPKFPNFGKLLVAMPYGGSYWVGHGQAPGLMDRRYIAATALEALDVACAQNLFSNVSIWLFAKYPLAVTALLSKVQTTCAGTSIWSYEGLNNEDKLEVPCPMACAVPHSVPGGWGGGEGYDGHTFVHVLTFVPGILPMFCLGVDSGAVLGVQDVFLITMGLKGSPLA